ncbi:hypothetical protein DPMN_014362 [Dreissena polymorpha]|uniref:Uncharacterized protein n=1 Tax=Dreissena polymorpha TaxID=45954 RepID=A0A9D4N911_DREPO|nr:hypothetical protein DPMN_014362 [Dreissena polymorpha]
MAITNKRAMGPKELAKNVTSRTPPPCDHVFLPIQTIFELNRHIHKTNVLTKFHEDWAKNVSSRLFSCFHNIHIETTAPPSGGHVFQMITTIFKLCRTDGKTDGWTTPKQYPYAYGGG